MRIKAYIAGCLGLKITPEEKRFFEHNVPWGFILFARNVETPEQVLALTDEMRSITGRADTPVLIDQEGGRVRRLRPPHWPEYPPARMAGELYKRDRTAGKRLAWLQARLIAFDLARLGINVDCLPVLDIPAEGAHDIIGDRAYSIQPYEVEQMARSACEGLLAGGLLPIVKHIPGHGRAGADSHKALPVVDAPAAVLQCTDFQPFLQLSDMPMAMTAHVVYSAYDAANPATTSPVVIGEVIREWMGFDGLLMSDDLSMNALSGDFSARARSAFAAGCDIVLHCNGEMEEMAEIADATGDLAGKAETRALAALARLCEAETDADEQKLRAEFAELSGIAA